MRSLVGIGGVYTNSATGGTVVLPTGYLYKPLVSWSSSTNTGYIVFTSDGVYP